jgi:hypothetical protein
VITRLLVLWPHVLRPFICLSRASYLCHAITVIKFKNKIFKSKLLQNINPLVTWFDSANSYFINYSAAERRIYSQIIENLNCSSFSQRNP